LFATIAPEKLASRELDASVGASGPHGFAVRTQYHSSFDIAYVHRIPSRVRDDREPPLQWDETARFMQVIWVGSEGRIFLAKGLDTDLLCCPSGKVGLPSQQPHRHPDVLAFGEPRRMLRCGPSFEARKSAHLQRQRRSRCAGMTPCLLRSVP